MIYYFPERQLSAKAQDLMEFDMASIRLLTHGAEPAIWLVSTELYEKDGRLFRDSTSPRLLAFFPDTQMVYVNDGCNSCSHALSSNIPQVQPDFLNYFREIVKRTGAK